MEIKKTGPSGVCAYPSTWLNKQSFYQTTTPCENINKLIQWLGAMFSGCNAGGNEVEYEKSHPRNKG